MAEILINPFGDDDDDFDCNHIVDSNYERSRAIVTAEEEEEEEDDEMPECLPHTVESYRHQEVSLLLNLIKAEEKKSSGTGGFADRWNGSGGRIDQAGARCL